MTILDYERVWGSLEALGKQAKEAAAAPPSADVDTKEAAGDAEKKEKEEKKPGEKLEKTNKVLIGKTTSWAVAKALGEVRRADAHPTRRMADPCRTWSTPADRSSRTPRLARTP